MIFADLKSNRLRKFDIFSLALAFIGWPVLFFSWAIYGIISNTYSLLDIEIIMFVFTGFLAVFLCSYSFGIPLIHYLKKVENKRDINSAKISYFSIFAFSFILFFFILLIQIE